MFANIDTHRNRNSFLKNDTLYKFLNKLYGKIIKQKMMMLFNIVS